METTTIITTAITAVATVFCGYLTYRASVADKQRKTERKDDLDRAERRRQEARLQLQMIHANTQLTVGVAMAMKHGHCNGEVEAGLEAVKNADEAYREFLESAGLESIR